MKRVLLLIAAGVLITACGISQRTVNPASTSSGSTENDPPSAYRVSKYNAMQVSLLQAYRDWKGTPYQIGGRSASGVDCSSFVSIIFDEYFGVDLPMHTSKLLAEGSGVHKRGLRTGDLVFFKTGRKTFHVGIMVKAEAGQFLHASTSQGVTMSDIHNTYWSDQYLGARRIM